ncbi:hypothetical protein D3C86_2139860 [compost metagenome]
MRQARMFIADFRPLAFFRRQLVQLRHLPFQALALELQVGGIGFIFLQLLRQGAPGLVSRRHLAHIGAALVVQQLAL